MALHTELKIYKDASDLLRVVTAAVVQMPKGAKPVIGRRLIDDCLQVTERIRQANAAVGRDKAPERVAHIEKLLGHVANVKDLLGSSWDQRLVSNGRYGKAAQLTVEIGKQANGWRTKSQQPVASGARP